MWSHELPDERWIYAYEDEIRRCVERSGWILELGCGPGRDSYHLLRMGSVVAVDVNGDALAEAAQRAPEASRVRADISAPLPFDDERFPVIVASLSLHYFSWQCSKQIVGEVERCLRPSGLLLVRLNSVNDINHGARSSYQIEENYLRVGSRKKRFFDEASIRRLFQRFTIESLQEREILRYALPKWIWEVQMRKE